MNVVGVRHVNPGHGHKVVGLAYVKCVLDNERLVLKDVNIEDFTTQNKLKITTCCFHLLIEVCSAQSLQ